VKNDAENPRRDDEEALDSERKRNPKNTFELGILPDTIMSNHI